MDLRRGSHFDQFWNSLSSNMNPYLVNEITYQNQIGNILSIENGDLGTKFVSKIQ